MTRDEKSALMAEYMGPVIEQWYPNNIQYPEMTGMYAVYPKDKYPANEKHCGVGLLKYDNDWNWLVPVIQKLLQDLREAQKQAGMIADDMSLGILESYIAVIELRLLNLVIEELFECCIRAIMVLNK